MSDLAVLLRPWVTFAGGVLVVFVLSWPRVVLEPIALAVLFTFLLAPVVGVLQRWIGRVPAVVGVTILVGAVAAGMTATHVPGRRPLFRARDGHELLADAG